jgi:hypothetical protein
MPARKAIVPVVTEVRRRKGDIVESQRWGRKRVSSVPLAKESLVVESRSVEVKVSDRELDAWGYPRAIRPQRVNLELRYVLKTRLRNGARVRERFGPYWYAQVTDGDATLWAYVGKVYNVRKAIMRLGAKLLAARGAPVLASPRRAGAGTSESTTARPSTRARSTPAPVRHSSSSRKSASRSKTGRPRRV